MSMRIRLASLGANSVLVTRSNALDGKFNSLTIEMSKEEFLVCFNNWQNGALIQYAFPKLSSDEREFIKTGITRDQWDEIFGTD
jgi:hypothetical protein